VRRRTTSTNASKRYSTPGASSWSHRTGVNDKVSVGEYRHTTAYHLVERFQRTAYYTLKYSATIEDPNVFAAPWTEVGTFTLHPEWDIQEYICNENNHDYKELFERYK